MNRKLHFQGAVLLAGMVAALTPMAVRSAPPEPSGVIVTVTQCGRLEARRNALPGSADRRFTEKQHRQPME